VICVTNEVTTVSRSIGDATSGGMVEFRQKNPWMVYISSQARAVSQINYPWAGDPPTRSLWFSRVEL